MSSFTCKDQGQYNTGAQDHVCYPNGQRYFLLFPARRRTIPLGPDARRPPSFLSILGLLDGAAMFGTNREMDRTMNGIPITVGSTKKVSCDSWYNSGHIRDLSTKMPGSWTPSTPIIPLFRP